MWLAVSCSPTEPSYVERVDAARQRLGQKKRASKSTFVCPGCRWQIWGKPDTRVRCDGCNELLVAKVKP
jgi:ribosomal protein S27E